MVPDRDRLKVLRQATVAAIALDMPLDTAPGKVLHPTPHKLVGQAQARELDRARVSRKAPSIVRRHPRDAPKRPSPSAAPKAAGPRVLSRKNSLKPYKFSFLNFLAKPTKPSPAANSR